LQAQALSLLDRDDWVEMYAWFSLTTDGWLGERCRPTQPAVPANNRTIAGEACMFCVG
jgi:hypothetical protein